MLNFIKLTRLANNFLLNNSKKKFIKKLFLGFFFAHVGWLMLKKHPEVIKKGNQIDMSDVLSDPVVQFHQK